MIHGRKFGRVVKAVALGAILVRGRGSNPLACNFFLLDVFVVLLFSFLFASLFFALHATHPPIECILYYVMSGVPCFCLYVYEVGPSTQLIDIALVV